MKIIHLADLHLDSKMEGFPLEFARLRREELIVSLEQAVDFGIKNNVKVVIIAGDVFDGEIVFEKTKKRLFRLFENNKSIDFLLLEGNHDKGDFIKEATANFDNVKSFTEDWINYNYGEINICGVNGKNGVNYEELDLPDNAFNIAVFHGQIVDYATNDNSVISLPKLKGKNLDYVALGHLHTYIKKRLDERGEYAYSGCLEGRGFDELGKKGFVIIDTNCDGEKTKFIPFSKREYFVKEFLVSKEENLDDVLEKIIDNVSCTVAKNDVVKVVIKGETSDACGINENSLLDRLTKYTKEVFISNKLKFLDKETGEENINSLYREFVSLISKTDMGNLMKNDVIMCGIKALKGEEI